MVIAALALVGFFVALYLWLWKIGFLGEIACGAGGCETVQLSDYAVIAGLPVAFYGVLGYAVLFAVSLLGLSDRWLGQRSITLALVTLSGLGVAFTGYLTYLEAFVIGAWCRWCLVSAGIITAVFVASLLGLREISGQAAGDQSRRPDAQTPSGL